MSYARDRGEYDYRWIVHVPINVFIFCSNHRIDHAGEPMTNLKDIPDEVKWRYAANLAVLLPALYDSAFRPALGKKFDEIEQEIWVAISRVVLGCRPRSITPLWYRKRARRQPACRDGNSLWSRLQIRNP